MQGTVAVYLTAEELQILRLRLSDGASTPPAANEVLDEKLSRAQQQLDNSDVDRIAAAMREAKENPGSVVGVAE